MMPAYAMETLRDKNIYWYDQGGGCGVIIETDTVEGQGHQLQLSKLKNKTRSCVCCWERKGKTVYTLSYGKITIQPGITKRIVRPYLGKDDWSQREIKDVYDSRYEEISDLRKTVTSSGHIITRPYNNDESGTEEKK